MLTRELLRYRVIESRLIAKYLKGSLWKKRAQDVLQLYQDSIGLKWVDFHNEREGLLSESNQSNKVIKGLFYILDKKVESEIIDDHCFQSMREEAFLYSSQLIKDGDISYAEFIKNLNIKKSKHQIDLYGDLPLEKKIVNVSKWNAEQLLQRYNLSLLQGLLSNAKKVTLFVKMTDAQRLRYLFRYLSFFGLLFQEKGSIDNKIRIDIEGPLSLFDSITVYKNKIAVFSGCLPQLTEFHLEAQIQINHQMLSFSVSDKDRIKSHYLPFYDYTPKEVKSFLEKITPKLKKMGLQESEISLPNLPVQEWSVPDFSWKFNDSKLIHLEIYFKSQKSKLFKRLNKSFSDKSSYWIFMVEQPLLNEIRVNNYKLVNFIPFRGVPNSKEFLKVVKSIILL